MKLAILVTGGTFDKEYNKLTGRLHFRRTHVPEMLSLGRCRVKTRLHAVMMKDSLAMNHTGRQKILRSCRNAPESRIVITHGTDTMEKTARFLGPKINNKTIVLTGAMVPYRFGSSDGMFNLGAAIALAQVLPPGVFVAMNGRCFRWDQVTKNRRRGYFRTKIPCGLRASAHNRKQIKTKGKKGDQ